MKLMAPHLTEDQIDSSLRKSGRHHVKRVEIPISPKETPKKRNLKKNSKLSGREAKSGKNTKESPISVNFSDMEDC
jgi:hypothetical protein